MSTAHLLLSTIKFCFGVVMVINDAVGESRTRKLEILKQEFWNADQISVCTKLSNVLSLF